MTGGLPAEPGLCGACKYARAIVSRRGSTFLLCGRSSFDPAFPRYPGLPVLACVGFVALSDSTPGTGDSSPRE
jgi:hypothetical protein